MHAAPTAVPERPPYAWAALVSVATLGLYVATIAPTTQFWDASEYIAAAKVLGIPHPPGNPLFVFVANVWGQIPLVEHYALRINLFAAVTSALASGFLFLVAERLLRDLIPHRAIRLATAAAGIVVGATSFTVWNQSVVNEKVYTLSQLSIGLILWLGILWADKLRGGRRDQLLLVILYLLALTSTNHTMSLLAAPGVMVLVLMTLWCEKADLGEWSKWLMFCLCATLFVFLPGILADWTGSAITFVAGLAFLAAMVLAVKTGESRFAVLAIAVSVVGLSLNGVLPLRAAQFPAINEGEPVTWDALVAVLDRQQYQKGPLIPRQADLLWQYLNYLQYFSWQFGRDWGPAVSRFLAVGFAALGLTGAVWHWRRDVKRAAAMTALMVTVTVLLVFYLDFKYGYSLRPDQELHEVRERDYFFVASFQLWGVWVALGLAAILEWGATTIGRAKTGMNKWVVATPVLLICFIPLAGNWLSASRAGETLPRDVAWDILQSVEPYGILITAGDNDTFPLWYMQEVEGVRRDILVANLSLMNTQWHIRQLKRRDLFPFDTDNALPLYRDRVWPLPTEPALSPSYEELDALPPYYQLGSGQTFQRGGISATLPEILERADIVALRLIQDNLGERPIYISRTAGNYGERMGLAPYLLGQGMARKLMPEPVAMSDSIVNVSTLGWVDVERTRALLFDVYHAESAARERPFGWIDEPSESILTLYAIMYGTFSQILAAQAADSGAAPADPGMTELADSATALAQRMFENTSFGRYAGR
ncbi:MAG: DUF2723 domain-containing protein [Gemmatimonadota bacterium]|nr:MAG: DUF2723 domain-containing protein [Gemmatimonadota bacterium]